jgi:aryl-alcohol dehydrogenase-like predicted oxidoreductase
VISRREWIGITAGAGAALGLTPRLLQALQQGQLLKRAIPSSGEMLPVIGLGSSATFSQVARSEEVTALKEVFQAMVSRGASVFDTAPGYGASEEVAGRIVNELGIADKMFWATKVNVAGRGSGGAADPAAARAQIEQSFARIKRPKIDLIQVHNLGDVPTQLAILKELKKAGRVRYIGARHERFPVSVADIMRNEPTTSSASTMANNRNVEETILPLAQERKIRWCVRRSAARAFPARGREGASRWEGARGGDVRAALPQVHPRPPGRDRDHARDEPGEEHAGQHRRRRRSGAKRGAAQADHRIRRCTAAAPAAQPDEDLRPRATGASANLSHLREGRMSANLRRRRARGGPVSFPPRTAMTCER